MSYTPPDYSIRPSATLLAARERAIALLTDRFADDSIGEAEFEARLSWLSASDDPARIDQLVADLVTPRATRTVARYDANPVEDRLTAVMCSTARTGPWTLPTHLVVRAIMSDLTIDLRYAMLPPYAEIHLQAVMTSVRIIVPRELSVETRLSAVMASVRNEASDLPWLEQRPPRLTIGGYAVMADVHIALGNDR